MAACNAANEVAVAAFLDGQIRFTRIPWIIEQTLGRMPVLEPSSLAVVESADQEARQLAGEQLATLLSGDRRIGQA
jgi:1-deoxy-D-xylulose-5-phosphate reductoisomerase